MNHSSASIVIIGGGVIGLMLARQLTIEGYKVAVLEKNAKAASEASRAGGGIISPLHPWRYSQPMLDLAQWSHDNYRQIAKELSLATGIHVPVNKTGMLVPNVDEAAAALKCQFLNAERVVAAQIADIEPGIKDPQDSVWVSEVHNVRNPALCRALLNDVQMRGAAVITNFSIQKIKKMVNGFTFYAADKRSVSTDRVVVCAGAWSGKVLQCFKRQLCLGKPHEEKPDFKLPDIFPVKGQMLAVQTKVGTLRSVILQGNRYLIPRHDGVVLVGSTVEDAGYDKQTTGSALKELLAFAHATIPATRFCRVISQWSGLRPGCRRDTPIISAVTAIPGMYVSIGHFRNGLLSAPASAQLAADLICGRKSVFDEHAYSL